MTEEMWITKKELLDMTGISYGQLYRWKREGLIPEGWFVKRSSFTGQETYFPRKKILARIRNILSLKDSMSLEELARRLSPELTSRLYSVEVVRACEDIHTDVLMLWGLERESFQFSFQEVVLMAALSLYKVHCGPDLDLLRLLVRKAITLSGALEGEISHDLCFMQYGDGVPFLLIEKESAPALLDSSVRLLDKLSLTNLADALKARYGRLVNEELPVEEEQK